MALIIFDYDGVLADTIDDLLRFGQAACDRLGVGHSVTRDDLGRLEEMSFSSFGRACEVPEHLVDEFAGICLSSFALKNSPPAIFADVGEVVRHLSTHHRLAIVTTNSTNNVKAFLVKHNLDGCIHAVYGIEAPGSKAKKISMARNRLLSDERQEPAFMVGDSLSDILAAREASVASIAVTWGHQSLEYLLQGDPDYVVASPSDLIGIIEP